MLRSKISTFIVTISERHLLKFGTNARKCAASLACKRFSTDASMREHVREFSPSKKYDWEEALMAEYFSAPIS